MNFKKHIESHPISYIITIILSTATITAATVSWIYTKENSLLELQWEEKTAGVKNDMQSKINNLTTRIDDLSTKIVSIERRAGDINSYFDITTIQIPRSSAKMLQKKNTKSLKMANTMSLYLGIKIGNHKLLPREKFYKCISGKRQQT